MLQQLVAVAPDKKTYWMQLSSVYGQMEDYPNALAIMQLANNAGLVTEDSEVRRLADLLLFNDVPYRGAQVLEAAIEKKIVNARRQALREARELLDRGRRVRQVRSAAAARRRACADAATCSCASAKCRCSARTGRRRSRPFERGVDKGQLKDAGNAQLMLGIAHYSQKNYDAAVPFFERARQSEKHRQSRGQLPAGHPGSGLIDFF